MIPPTKAIRGLYAVTPDIGNTDVLLAMTQAALSGGVGVVQYRNKTATPALRRAQSRELLKLCNEHGAILLVNDHVALAGEIGAHGVHIGGEDGSLAEARAVLGPDKLIGVSCYRDLERGRAAVDGGANYIAFGGFYPSTVKPSATRAPVSLLTSARAFDVPVVAIGGITPDNAATLISAGADAVAVITALFFAQDIGAAAKLFGNLFNSNTA
jgi:thiamine-phosphate pyrophosphorylase